MTGLNLRPMIMTVALVPTTGERVGGSIIMKGAEADTHKSGMKGPVWALVVGIICLLLTVVAAIGATVLVGLNNWSGDEDDTPNIAFFGYVIWKVSALNRGLLLFSDYVFVCFVTVQDDALWDGRNGNQPGSHLLHRRDKYTGITLLYSVFPYPLRPM
jgi:hypothetical protein